MSDEFFKRPILNSPYEYPARHWELDASGQPTTQIIERRRDVSFITPIPKPKKQKRVAVAQADLVFDAAAAQVSTAAQQYSSSSCARRFVRSRSRAMSSRSR